ncbi:hypothetical protein [Brenneria tiliae]|nr:hypothetical protein [Brenneria tiliae]MCL2896879.1 hypothetical protein [Brenneria tiliae]MCL2901437.1 hypothetical protein [Brenneria tiliae]
MTTLHGKVLAALETRLREDRQRHYGDLPACGTPEPTGDEWRGAEARNDD